MPEMNYSELKKNVSSENFHKIYFLSGEEYIVEYFEKLLCDKILGENYSDFDISIFTEENLNLSELSVALETLPIKSAKKCVIIHDLPLDLWKPNETENFIKIISDIPDFSNLIISQLSEITGTKSSTNFKKIQKTILKNGVISNFSKKDIPIEKQLIFWAKKEHGKNLPEEYAKIIKSMCINHSLTALKNEIKKICEFESSDTITENSLKIISGSKTKTKIFELPKAILLKDAKKAFKVLDELMEQKEDAIPILAAISADFIDIYRVKIFGEKNKQSELTQIFDYKNKEFRLKNAEKYCHNIDASNIKQCLKYLLETDLKLKSTTLDPKLVLSQTIANLIKINQ